MGLLLLTVDGVLTGSLVREEHAAPQTGETVPRGTVFVFTAAI